MSALLATYLGSRELKNAIIKRKQEFDIPFRYICHEIGCNYNHFMKSYINSQDARDCKLTEKQFERLLEIMGIKMRFQFVIDSKYKCEIKETLKNNYEEARSSAVNS